MFRISISIFIIMLPLVSSAQEGEAAFHKTVLEKLYKNEWSQTKEQLLEKAGKRQSEDVLFDLGCTSALQGEFEEAEKYFNRLLTVVGKSDKAFIYFNLGGIYYARAMKNSTDVTLAQKAAENFNKAYSLMPTFSLAYDLASFSSRMGKKGTTLSVEATGIPPDTAIFTKKSNSVMNVESYFFDDTVPPPIYFYKSAAYSLLRTSAENPSIICPSLGNILQAAQQIPSSSYREDILQTISDVQEQCKHVSNN